MYFFYFSVENNVNSTSHLNNHEVCKSNKKTDTESSDSDEEEIEPNKNNVFGET